MIKHELRGRQTGHRRPLTHQPQPIVANRTASVVRLRRSYLTGCCDGGSFQTPNPRRWSCERSDGTQSPAKRRSPAGGTAGSPTRGCRHRRLSKGTAYSSRAANDGCERWGPAAIDVRIVADLNGWPPSAPHLGRRLDVSHIIVSAMQNDTRHISTYRCQSVKAQELAVCRS